MQLKSPFCDKVNETMSDPNESADLATPQEPPQVTITTLPFELTPKEYLRISINIYVGKCWWLSLLYLFLLLSMQFLKMLYMGYFGTRVKLEMANNLFMWQAMLMVFAVCFILFLYYYLRAAAYHPSNRAIMVPRTMTFDKKQIIAKASNEGQDDVVESVWVYKKEDVFQVANLSWCYLFFITPIMFVFIPKIAFQTPEDREYFEKEILSLYPPKKLKYWQGALSCMAVIFIGIVVGVIASLNF